MVHSVLIIKTSAIGDVIQAFPAVELLKKSFPEAEIDWVVEEGIASLVRSHPAIHGVFPISTKRWKKNLLTFSTYREIFNFIKTLRQKRYEVVIDLQGNCKSGVINLLAKSSKKIGFDRKGVAEWPNLLTTHQKIATEACKGARECYQELVRGLVEDKSLLEPTLLLLEEGERVSKIFCEVKRPVLVVGFGSKWENKKIAPEVFKSFLENLQKTLGAFFIVPHTAGEKKEAEALTENVASLRLEDFSLPECQHLIQRSDGFIGVDSALLHLAQMTQVPVFSIFGPSSSDFYMKKEGRVMSYQGVCPYGKTFKRRCDILRSCKDAPCIKKIHAEDLTEAFLAFWESNSPAFV